MVLALVCSIILLIIMIITPENIKIREKRVFYAILNIAIISAIRR